MYDVNDYGRMMADRVRMTAYTEALRRAVKPGAVVVDVGTGTGVFALLAAKLGARKVYAIDTNPCIHLAREVAARNGFADRIEFIHASVFDVSLPERADVVIADCRGAFTLHGRNLDIMMRARSFLRPGGVQIAKKDELMVAVVEWPSVYGDLEKPWQTEGFDWSPCRAEGMSQEIVAPDRAFSGAAFLTDSVAWAVVDFATLARPTVRGSVRAKVKRAGRAQFLVLSFRTTLYDDIQFSNTDPNLVSYMPILLPLDPSLEVEADEHVDIAIDALHSVDDYIFAWSVGAKAGARRHATDGQLARLLVLNSRAERGTLPLEGSK